jgi:tRNA nucleotidyltransferase/poly(A) polymerase
LKRRDFNIIAIAFDVKSEELIDISGGLEYL